MLSTHVYAHFPHLNTIYHKQRILLVLHPLMGDSANELEDGISFGKARKPAKNSTGTSEAHKDWFWDSKKTTPWENFPLASTSTAVLLWFIINNTFISRFMSLTLCTHLGVIIDYHGGIELMRQKLADSQRIELRSFPACCLCFCLPKLKISMLVLSWNNSQVLNHPMDYQMSLNKINISIL